MLFIYKQLLHIYKNLRQDHFKQFKQFSIELCQQNRDNFKTNNTLFNIFISY